MMPAVRMEWTKLRTIRATGWSLLALFVPSLALSALAAAQTGPADCAPRPCTLDPTTIALTGVYIGQIAVVALATLAVTTEYDTSSIRTTLAAMPCRLRVLTAKTVVVTAMILTTASLTLLGCLAVSRILLVRNGFNELNGYQRMLEAGDGHTRQAYLGAVFYLCAIGVLGLGLAAIVRHTATTITIMLAALYVPVIVAKFVTDPDWQRRITEYSPMTAGRGTLSAYAAVAILLGAFMFQRRDA